MWPFKKQNLDEAERLAELQRMREECRRFDEEFYARQAVIAQSLQNSTPNVGDSFEHLGLKMVLVQKSMRDIQADYASATGEIKSYKFDLNVFFKCVLKMGLPK